jgi:hypothetical protein
VCGCEVSFCVELLLVGVDDVKFVSRANLHAQVAIGACCEVLYSRIVILIEAEGSGWTDADAGTASMTQAAINYLTEAPQGAWSLIVLVLGPREWINHGATLPQRDSPSILPHNRERRGLFSRLSVGSREVMSA